MDSAEIYSKIVNFPHQVDYIISVQTAKDGPKDKMLVHCANYQGEIFIYDVNYNQKQVVNSEGRVTEDCLELVDMVIL